MKQNMSNADRIIRLVLAAVIAGLYFTGMLTGTVAIVLLVLAGIFLLTSLAGYCPVYAIFGWNTRSERTGQSH